MSNDFSDDTFELPAFGRVRQWKLRFTLGAEERRRVLRQGQSLTVGKGDEADLAIVDRTVSSMHCRISAEAEGLRVTDLGSKNGVYVGAGRIEEVLLQASQSSFSLGRTLVHVQEDKPPTETETMGLIGQAPSMLRLRETIRRFAPLKKPVLVLGESGTGKDVVSRALHRYSGRSGSFVETNIAAFPDSLLDAELFGYQKGAFTGAISARVGLFEEANEGTLFMDEIAELSRAGQAKLLRIVEDGKVRSLGMNGYRRTQTRLITATCASLVDLMAEGSFREDLFHRLSLLTIRVPPLRKRLGDIVPLATHFLNSVAEEVGPKYLLPESIHLLKEHTWPGNVRELFAVLYRAAVLADGDALPPGLFQLETHGPRQTRRMYPQQAAQLLSLHENVSAAARAAGLPRSTFRSLLKRAKEIDAEAASVTENCA